MILKSLKEKFTQKGNLGSCPMSCMVPFHVFGEVLSCFKTSPQPLLLFREMLKCCIQAPEMFVISETLSSFSIGMRWS